LLLNSFYDTDELLIVRGQGASWISIESISGEQIGLVVTAQVEQDKLTPYFVLL
jgi:hypothetical protein